MCTDGAAVNVGMYNGVVPKLRQLAVVGDSLENCAKSADRNVPYCETLNRSVVRLLQFYLQKVGAKKNCCAEEAV